MRSRYIEHLILIDNVVTAVGLENLNPKLTYEALQPVMLYFPNFYLNINSSDQLEFLSYQPLPQSDVEYQFQLVMECYRNTQRPYSYSQPVMEPNNASIPSNSDDLVHDNIENPSKRQKTSLDQSVNNIENDETSNNGVFIIERTHTQFPVLRMSLIDEDQNIVRINWEANRKGKMSGDAMQRLLKQGLNRLEQKEKKMMPFDLQLFNKKDLCLVPNRCWRNESAREFFGKLVDTFKSNDHENRVQKVVVEKLDTKPVSEENNHKALVKYRLTRPGARDFNVIHFTLCVENDLTNKKEKFKIIWDESASPGTIGNMLRNGLKLVALKYPQPLPYRISFVQERYVYFADQKRKPGSLPFMQITPQEIFKALVIELQKSWNDGSVEDLKEIEVVDNTHSLPTSKDNNVVDLVQEKTLYTESTELANQLWLTVFGSRVNPVNLSLNPGERKDSQIENDIVNLEAVSIDPFLNLHAPFDLTDLDENDSLFQQLFNFDR